MKKPRYDKSIPQEETPILRTLERTYTLNALPSSSNSNTTEWHELAVKSPSNTLQSSGNKRNLSSVKSEGWTPSPTLVIKDTDLASSWIYSRKKAAVNSGLESEEIEKISTSPEMRRCPVHESDKIMASPDLDFRRMPFEPKRNSKLSCCCTVFVLIVVFICFLGIISSIGGIVYLEVYTKPVIKEMQQPNEQNGTIPNKSKQVKESDISTKKIPRIIPNEQEQIKKSDTLTDITTTTILNKQEQVKESDMSRKKMPRTIPNEQEQIKKSDTLTDITTTTILNKQRQVKESDFSTENIPKTIPNKQEQLKKSDTLTDAITILNKEEQIKRSENPMNHNPRTIMDNVDDEKSININKVFSERKGMVIEDENEQNNHDTSTLKDDTKDAEDIQSHLPTELESISPIEVVEIPSSSTLTRESNMFSTTISKEDTDQAQSTKSSGAIAQTSPDQRTTLDGKTLTRVLSLERVSSATDEDTFAEGDQTELVTDFTDIQNTWSTINGDHFKELDHPSHFEDEEFQTFETSHFNRNKRPTLVPVNFIPANPTSSTETGESERVEFTRPTVPKHLKRVTFTPNIQSSTTRRNRFGNLQESLSKLMKRLQRVDHMSLPTPRMMPKSSEGQQTILTARKMSEFVPDMSSVHEDEKILYLDKLRSILFKNEEQ